MISTQRSILLGLVLTVVTIALIVVASRWEEQRMTNTVLAQDARAIEQGADLYAENCRTCHGPQGEGVGEMGPPLNDEHFFTERLAEVGWTGTLEEYVLTTTSAGRVTSTRPLYAGDGVVVMTAWGQEHGGPLRPDEIQSVTNFVLNWEATAMGEYEIAPLPTPTPNAAQQSESIARGEQLFVDLGCAGCHALEGIDAAARVAEAAESESEDSEDVVAGPALDGIGAAAEERVPGQGGREYVRNAVLAPSEHVAEGYEEPGECSALLSEAQMTDLVNFVMIQR